MQFRLSTRHPVQQAVQRSRLPAQDAERTFLGADKAAGKWEAGRHLAEGPCGTVAVREAPGGRVRRVVTRTLHTRFGAQAQVQQDSMAGEKAKRTQAEACKEASARRGEVSCTLH